MVINSKNLKILHNQEEIAYKILPILKQVEASELEK
jgi:hypothetical protein